MIKGRIIKAVSDFYYVYSEGEYIICKAKGIFKKKNQTPLVGDLVLFEKTNTRDIEGNIMEILPRHSFINRPKVANLDQVLLVFALKDPIPNVYLLDRFLVIMESIGLEVILAFNKVDIDSDRIAGGFLKAYRDIGYRAVDCSVKENTGMDVLRGLLRGKVTALAGPSGVGKSSLCNALCNKPFMETGDISAKNKRGKQTTRHTQLNVMDDTSFIVDTPGFSNADIIGVEPKDLDLLFPEFLEHLTKCRFDDCNHIKEPDCAVKDALSAGLIQDSRYRSYLDIFEELKQKGDNNGRGKKKVSKD